MNNIYLAHLALHGSGGVLLVPEVANEYVNWKNSKSLAKKTILAKKFWWIFSTKCSSLYCANIYETSVQICLLGSEK